MPEKQAKGFGYGEKDATFQLKSQPKISDQGKPKEKQILLNIASKSGDKILIRKKQGSVQLTGNPLIDTFNKLNDWVIQQSKIKVKDKAVFFRLLAVMLNAGLPLIKSLDTLGVQFEKSPKLAKVLFAMAREIEKGASLSDAMGDYTDVFNDAEIGVVRAGEASGQMNKTLKSLALDVEKSASIAGKVKGAMIYPIVIMSLLVVAIFLMMTMVVPQITRLFTQTGEQLPLPTRILIAVSEFSVAYWPVVIGGVVLAIFLFGVFRKTRQGRYLLHQFAINVPIFGPLIRKTALSKFARGFSNMLGSGVPIIKSLEIISHAVGNEVYKRRFLLTAEDMKRGIPMAENMAESRLFPKMLVNMIEVGEQTAQLDNVMNKIADFYDEEIDNAVASLSKIMEPLILVIIGVTVGGLVAAIMLPIMQLTDAAGSF